MTDHIDTAQKRAKLVGFLTSEGRFVNRVMGKHIAHIAGQEQLCPESERHATQLFSEDLW